MAGCTKLLTPSITAERERGFRVVLTGEAGRVAVSSAPFCGSGSLGTYSGTRAGKTRRTGCASAFGGSTFAAGPGFCWGLEGGTSSEIDTPCQRLVLERVRVKASVRGEREERADLTSTTKGRALRRFLYCCPETNFDRARLGTPA